MKIAMFTDNFYPELSGIGDSIIDLETAFSQNGHQIHIFAPAYCQRDYDHRAKTSFERSLTQAAHVHRLPALPYPAPTGQGRLVLPVLSSIRALRKLKVDVVHTHLFFGAGIEALMASRVLNIPFVGTNHTPIGEFVRYGPRFLCPSSDSLRRYVSWYYNRCRLVTSPSEVLLEEMRKFGLTRPAFVVPNGVDRSVFFPADSTEDKLRIKSRFGLSGFTLLYSGRLAAEKHIDVLIRATAHLQRYISDPLLVLTGHGLDQDRLMKIACEHNISHKVRFLGTVSSEDLAQIFRGVDCFVMASTAETQSLSLIKAMASGVPVVTVSARGLVEYVSPSSGILVPPGNPEAFAQALHYLYCHPEERARLGAGGVKETVALSPDAIAARWVELYRSAMQPQGSCDLIRASSIQRSTMN